jgi:hypothetical protein
MIRFSRNAYGNAADSAFITINKKAALMALLLILKIKA